jgi:uncharacterized repeat protein (TIGR03803 family)
MGIISSGNVLYGTTISGGASNAGIVFSVTLPTTAGASIIEQDLFDLPSNQDFRLNFTPALGPQGTLFGTAYTGGMYHDGYVYSLTPPAVAGGEWNPTVLESFQPGGEAATNPYSGPVVGRGGVVYGTTLSGGPSDSGLLYALTPPTSAGGDWAYQLLYDFSPAEAFPDSLVIGPQGALYGTGGAYTGGATGGSFGDVFSLVPPVSPGGAWTNHLHYTFRGEPDGDDPASNLTMGADGVLYGSTVLGGSTGNGTVFTLTPPTTPGGAWTETIIWNMLGGNDGAEPSSQILIGKNGVLYGASSFGGTTGNGTLFSLTPPASLGDPWTHTVLYNFGGVTDGGYPSSIVFGEGSRIFGCAEGASKSYGTVFELIP